MKPGAETRPAEMAGAGERGAGKAGRVRVDHPVAGRLAGTVIATTRDGDPDDPLVARLRAEGCRVLVWPTLIFTPTRDIDTLRSAAARVAEYDWIVFTSGRGVVAFTGLVGDPPADVRVAAVGPATADELRARGWPVTTVGGGGADALVTRLAQTFSLDGARVLFPSASRARPTLQTALGRLGAAIDRVEAYHTRSTPPDAAAVRRDLSAGVDVVTFTSPSAVRSLSRALRDDWPEALSTSGIVTIGDTTAGAARDAGLVDVVTAPQTTLAGIIEGCALMLRRG